VKNSIDKRREGDYRNVDKDEEKDEVVKSFFILQREET